MIYHNALAALSVTVMAGCGDGSVSDYRDSRTETFFSSSSSPTNVGGFESFRNGNSLDATHQGLVGGLQINPNRFTDGVGGIFELSVDQTNKLILADRNLVVKTIESSGSPELSAACAIAITKKLADPHHPGEFWHDLWEQDEKPHIGVDPAFYKLHKAIIPVRTPGWSEEVHCFAITIAVALEEGTLASRFYKSSDLFLRQEPSSDNTWDGGYASVDGSYIEGESDLQRLKAWLRSNLKNPVIGIRWFEVIGRKQQRELDYRRDKVRAVVIHKV